MFTVCNKEILDVKRLKPVPFMNNVLKSKKGLTEKDFLKQSHSLYLPY